MISDGFYVKGRPHPRLYGTFPCLLGEIARQRGWLTLAEAVHKITGKPAVRFGLNNRGRLARVRGRRCPVRSGSHRRPCDI